MATNGFAYDEDGLATMHACDFESDERFRSAYQKGKGTGSWAGQDIRFRAYIACWAASQASLLDGDFVECGVNRGGSAITVADYVGLKADGRLFHLVDTYQGFVPEYLTDAERQSIRGYEYPDCYSFVVNLFRDWPNVKVIRGAVPDVLSSVCVNRVAYLHIDMNCTEPEIQAAEFFWPKLVPGAVVVLDDYGFARHGEQRAAFQQFAARHGVPILGLPTGQGLLIKAGRA